MASLAHGVAVATGVVEAVAVATGVIEVVENGVTEIVGEGVEGGGQLTP
jgi:hypothetical protein